jgi:hypothetical protein
MSALCQKRTHAPQQNSVLFDDLVGGSLRNLTPLFCLPGRPAMEQAVWGSPTIRAIIMWCYEATTDLSLMLQ